MPSRIDVADANVAAVPKIGASFARICQSSPASPGGGITRDAACT